MNPRQQVRMTAWNECADELPALHDGGILVYFAANDAVDLVNCEDYFREITAGLDENGNQKWTRWYLSQGVTHWALVPAPPTH